MNTFQQVGNEPEETLETTSCHDGQNNASPNEHICKYIEKSLNNDLNEAVTILDEKVSA